MDKIIFYYCLEDIYIKFKKPDLVEYFITGLCVNSLLIK